MIPMSDGVSILPAEFYSGRAKAHKALAFSVLIIFSSFAIVTASGHLDATAMLGPHVQRSEWAFSMTGARELAAGGLTGRGVTVCVVDSGLDDLHPDFSHSHVVAWRDFVNSRAKPYDDSGHGTAMVGLIAADGSSRGVAPSVNLIIAKVVDSQGEGTSGVVADGVRFCVDPRGDGSLQADIISMSLGSKAPLFVESKVYDAVAWATSRGIFVVAAAGNDGLNDDGDVEVPANVPLAIAVGAVDSNGQRASFSSIGASLNRTNPNLKPEVVAPGVRLITTSPGAHYVTVTGTSPATAIVAGILALVLEARPSLRASGTDTNILFLKDRLARGAEKLDMQVLPHDPWYGYGLVNGPATLNLL